jgi:hypothetical protein
MLCAQTFVLVVGCHGRESTPRHVHAGDAAAAGYGALAPWRRYLRLDIMGVEAWKTGVDPQSEM